VLVRLDQECQPAVVHVSRVQVIDAPARRVMAPVLPTASRSATCPWGLT